MWHLTTSLWCKFFFLIFLLLLWLRKRRLREVKLLAAGHTASWWWGYMIYFQVDDTKPLLLSSHAHVENSSLSAFVLWQVLVLWIQWEASARITSWNGTITRRSRLANSSGTAAVGAMPIGLKPRKNVSTGVSQHPYNVRQNLITASSGSIADETKIPFPETVPHSS